MKRFTSQILGKQARAGFKSGNAKIDHYFYRVVSQDIKRNYALCHVLIETVTGKIAGFYTLSAYSIPLSDLPESLSRKLPRYPTIPAALIGWLGRDLAFQGQGIGARLLRDAISRVLTSNIGAHALVVDAIDDNALAFYQKFGFIAFADNPSRLFLPLATAKQLLADN